MTRESVLNEIKMKIEAQRLHSIRILGNRKDQADALYILMNTQSIFSDDKEVYHGILISTMDLLKQAEIKFEVLK